ncbi:MAG: Heavy metal transport/detoxification protein [Thermotoga sp. 50_1627]|uniref:heavy-metal-associated domain-containing protein n=1 Tax=Pseudothermotoga sp. TaxID=2033661 RepID=UPI00076D2C9D|nr:MAG: Heavy metal transport/detoxification protein [Thermotoga sp. 50_64]KUK25848.1 MAG: Heavy metal transport/detoxification protein [Thermotoga sp. 50_1627]MBC7116169.1 heavy-metal-associated domain-containing protein [Pseudothermotoga sp.]
MKYELLVPDISCGHCRNRISKVLEELRVKNYQIDVQTKKVVLETQNLEAILKKLEQIGYPVESFRQI